MVARRIVEKQRPLTWGLLLVIFFLGAALRLYQLDADSLWFDEILTITTSELDIRSIIQFQIADKLAVAHPPLLYIVTHLFLASLGRSDFVARLPALLFGSLSILLIYKAGEMLWARKEGLAGSFLLAISAYHVGYSQEARHYGLMVFLALLSLIFLLGALQKKQTKLWIAFVLCATLSIYNHYFAFSFLAAEALFAAWVITEDWLSSRKEVAHASNMHADGGLSAPSKQAVALSLSLALIALSFVPWLSVLQPQLPGVQPGLAGGLAPNLRYSLSFLYQVVTSYSNGVDTGNLRPETARVGPILGEGVLSLPVWQNVAVLVFLALFLLGVLTCGRRQLVLVALWMGVPFTLLALVDPRTFIHARHVLFILPVYLLVIARGTTSLSRLVGRLSGASRRRRRSRLLLASTGLFLGVVSLLPLQNYYHSRKEDWRGAAAYLRENMQPGDIILADSRTQRGGAAKAKLSLSYYLNTSDAPDIPILLVSRGLWHDLEEIDQRNGEVWAVLVYRGTAPPTRAVTTADFHKVLVGRLRQSSERVLQDTISMLQALLDILPSPEARFDVHLALAEISLQTGELEEAVSQLHQASLAQPEDPTAARDLAEMRTELVQRSHLANADIQHPLWRSLGDVVALLGHSTNQEAVQGGDSARLTIWWQALADIDRDYTVFIHVVGPDDRIWAQVDTLVLRNGRPTSMWKVGEIVTQEYELRLPPEIPAGEYRIAAGMYYWKTGQRLPVCDQNQELLRGDTVFLQPLVVRE